MSALELFDFSGQEVRLIADESGRPWFIAADVCAVLGITNHRAALARLDEDEKGVGTTDTLGGKQQVATVSEEGVYGLTWTSRKPAAAAFRRWIKRDVLPAIRETGTYALPHQRKPGPALPASYAEALRELAASVEQREALAAERDAAVTQIAELEPAAAAWNEVATAEGSVLVGDAAKMLQNAGIDTGPIRLFTQMEALGWIYRWSSDDGSAHGPWKPKQEQLERSRLTEVPTTYVHPKTKVRTVGNPQIRVTMKGVEKLHDLMGRKRLALN